MCQSLEKSKRLVISNWARNPLSNEQIAYSARDAWAGAAIVEELGRRDPEKFGMEALKELLSTQPNLKALRKSQRERGSARKALRQFNKSFQGANASMTADAKRRVEHLKQVLKDTDLDYFTAVEELGFIENEQPSSS